MNKINKIYNLYKEFGMKLIAAKIISKFNYNKRISMIYKVLIEDIVKDMNHDFIEENPQLIQVEKEDFKIFVFWWQGRDELPQIVRLCIDSIEKNSKPFSVHIITKNNYEKYVQISPIIKNKLISGDITLTHFSDILRFNLLYQYGGVWLDATIFLTSPIIFHEEIYTSSLFTQKFTRGKKIDANNPSYGRWAGFCMSTNIIHHPLFYFGKKFFDMYWGKHNVLIDYFLIDYLILIGYNNIPFVKREIDKIPVNNTDIFWLMDNINNQYEGGCLEKWSVIKKRTWIFKMSYKKPLIMNTNTFFYQIMNREK